MFWRTIRSMSVSVVELLAPMCSTASSCAPWRSSQGGSASGSTRSAMLVLGEVAPALVLAAASRTTTTSWPRSDSAATRFEPMKPAPPVIRRTCGQAPRVAAARRRSPAIELADDSAAATRSATM